MIIVLYRVAFTHLYYLIASPPCYDMVDLHQFLNCFFSNSRKFSEKLLLYVMTAFRCLLHCTVDSVFAFSIFHISINFSAILLFMFLEIFRNSFASLFFLSCFFLSCFLLFAAFPFILFLFSFNFFLIYYYGDK